MTRRRNGANAFSPARTRPRAACTGSRLVSSERLRRSTPTARDEHVEMTGAGVSRDHRLAARIVSPAQRPGYAVGKRGGVAKAEIEPLRAERRHDVRRLADERGTPGGKRLGGEACDREGCARADVGDLAERVAEPVLEAGGELRLIHRHQRVDLGGRADPNQGRLTRLGHRHGGDRSRALCAVSVDTPSWGSVWRKLVAMAP